MSWKPTAANEVLKFRSDLLWKIRSFFRQLDFVEVTTPTLSRDTVVDRHIDPIELRGTQVDASDSTFYLQTSPEFAMKRLLAAGQSAIFQVCPAYRVEERGDFHNPEFTMLEWYRCGDDLEAGIALLAQLCELVLPSKRVSQETYQEAFVRQVDIDPLDCAASDLSVLSEQLGVRSDWSHDKDDWLNLVFSHLVQPSLGVDGPTILTHYPASQSALAKISTVDPRVSERFELFIDGIELANGYHELLDADVLMQRNVQVNQERELDGKKQLPQQSRLLEAMKSGLPACSGCALGVERLIMALLKKPRIDNVLPFPIENA